MPWQIGIDEAGYGPNLGPFVMTLVACQVPAKLLEANLWEVLRDGVRCIGEPADHRLVVADSKQVYAPARGWEALEKTVLSAHTGGFFDRPATLHAILEHLAADDLPLLRAEPWLVGDTALPTAVPADDLAVGAECWRKASQDTGVRWAFCQSAIIAAPRFNELIDRWDSKGAVLSVAITQLIEQCLQKAPEETIHFVIDKHGGRNLYSALLQQAFSSGMVLAQEEGRERSVYRVEGIEREVKFTFMPRADLNHFTVALASMFSKYVRELFMQEFNRFWQTHVPGLKPTAGYPLDAERYFAAIQPAMRTLGICAKQIWRSR
jgi:ribonuclease HII